MQPRTSYKKQKNLCLALIVGILLELIVVFGYAEEAHFGINLSNSKEPIELHADSLEIRDKEGVAVFSGNVSIVQGERFMQTSQLIVYYDKAHKAIGENKKSIESTLPIGFDVTGIKKMEALGRVYIKIATQIATGDKGIFDRQSNRMILIGNKVVLRDNNNVATGCKLTVHMESGKAFLEGCQAFEKKNRASIILKSSQK
ncbi:LptA/OstA family protein [Bartonella sp. WD16.2]|uniref:LptA/OstA family protein n=1 Tax=Bartonella sp. WD16.2 TaxID=1933904 RepID=UPI00099AC253|nr:LptA/OstA family protein [Bartonella sp. WD16.2]AQX20576.1 lipopolysaccharide export system protein LptA [Bartonella sp. WD16.2]